MTVADSVQIPVFLYNIPARTGVNLSVDTVRRLAQAGNIVGIKDSSGNFDQILQYIEATPSDFTVLSGNDSLVLWTLQAGEKAASVESPIFSRKRWSPFRIMETGSF